jgi:hypothetical protein
VEAVIVDLDFAPHVLTKRLWHVLNIVVLLAFASFNAASSASLSSRDMVSGSLLGGILSKWDEKREKNNGSDVLL